MGNIFDKFKNPSSDNSEELEKFINSIAEADNQNHNLAFLSKKQAFSIIYLAKQIEESSKLTIESNEKLAKSAEKQSKALNGLTVILVILTITMLLKMFSIV